MDEMATLVNNNCQKSVSNGLHETMLAVETSSIKVTSVGGAGQAWLWSWNRPFMPVYVLSQTLIG
jgi:hypothetical protein